MMPSPMTPTFFFAIASLRWRVHPTARRYTAVSPAFKHDLRIGHRRTISRVPNRLSSRRLPNDAAVRGSSQEAGPMQIGIAGIGKMGAAIAQRLIEVGHTVTVWNRSADKLKPLAAAGAALAATPAELADKSEVIITILTDAAAIDAVYGGASGLLAGDVHSKLFIEMSTVRPQTELALAAKVRAKDAAIVE